MDFESGVKAYVTGECIVKVHFPIDWKGNADVCCFQCKYFSRASGICYLTKEVSEYPGKYIASTCPMSFDGEIKEKE